MRFCAAYYLLNIFSLLLYPLYRALYSSKQVQPLLLSDSFVQSNREAQILTMYSVLVFISYWKSVTLDQFLSQIFTVGKIVVMLLFFFIDRRPCILYTLLCFVLWLVLKQPKLQHPSLVDVRNESHFQQLQAFSESRLPGIIFLVFYANWNERCTYTQPLWVDFASKYSNKLFIFAQINIERTPGIAKQFKIQRSARSQLPALLLIDQNKTELVRFPPLDKKGRPAQVRKYDPKLLAKHFDLAQRSLVRRNECLKQEKRNSDSKK